MILRFTSPWHGGRIYLSFNTQLETWNCAANEPEGEGLQFIRINQKAMKAILQEIDFNCYNYANNLHDPAKIEPPAEAEEIPF